MVPDMCPFVGEDLFGVVPIILFGDDDIAHPAEWGQLLLDQHEVESLLLDPFPAPDQVSEPEIGDKCLGAHGDNACQIDHASHRQPKPVKLLDGFPLRIVSGHQGIDHLQLISGQGGCCDRLFPQEKRDGRQKEGQRPEGEQQAPVQPEEGLVRQCPFI